MYDIALVSFTEYNEDIRVRKKALSLSKKYNVLVINIRHNTIFPKKKEIINKNLTVKRYFISKLRFKIRYLFNYCLLKKIVLENPSKIYDCNDPDTLNAGYIGKKLYNSKIVYDSHELWSNYRTKSDFGLKNFYNLLYSYFMLRLEKKKIYLSNKIITVSRDIKYLIETKYNIYNINVIYNYDTYKKNNLSCSSKIKAIVFIGRYREGVEDILNEIFIKYHIKPIIIGFHGNYKNIEYTGFLREKEFIAFLKKCDIGLVFLKITNLSQLFGCSNKANQYLQNNLPMFAIDTPYNYDFIEKNNFGIVFNHKNYLTVFKKILNKKNYDLFFNNIKKNKKKYSWESQEKKLFEIYSD
jgi:hypothetical protein